MTLPRCVWLLALLSGCSASPNIIPECAPAYDACVSQCAPKCEASGSDFGNEAMNANQLTPDRGDTAIKVDCYQCVSLCKEKARQCEKQRRR